MYTNWSGEQGVLLPMAALIGSFSLYDFTTHMTGSNKIPRSVNLSTYLQTSTELFLRLLKRSDATDLLSDPISVRVMLCRNDCVKPEPQGINVRTKLIGVLWPFLSHSKSPVKHRKKVWCVHFGTANLQDAVALLQDELNYRLVCVFFYVSQLEKKTPRKETMTRECCPKKTWSCCSKVSRVRWMVDNSRFRSVSPRMAHELLTHHPPYY